MRVGDVVHRPPRIKFLVARVGAGYLRVRPVLEALIGIPTAEHIPAAHDFAAVRQLNAVPVGVRGYIAHAVSQIAAVQVELDAVRVRRPLGIAGLVAVLRIADSCDRAPGELFVIVPPGKCVAGLLDIRRQRSALAIAVIGNIAALYRAAVGIECDAVRL